MNAFRPVPEAMVRRQAAQEKPSWRLALEHALRVLGAAAVSAALAFGAFTGFQRAKASPFFAVREVRFSGLVHAQQADLLRRSGLAPGENIFAADLLRAERGIAAHPWVAGVRLARRLPGIIEVEVAEHRAAALVQLGLSYVLDEDGVLFKRAASEDRLDLPVVTGLAREDWQKDRPDTKLRALSALHLLDAWRGAGLAMGDLSEIRLDEGGAATLFVHDPDAAGRGDALQEVRLGEGQWALKLSRLKAMRAALVQRGARAARVDLDVRMPGNDSEHAATAAATIAQER